EIWKPIINHEGKYSISSFGNIKTHFRKANGIVERYVTETIKKPFKTKRGYLKIMLYNGGKPLSCSIHRLVAIHFIPNPNNFPQVNHINGIKDDNRVENIEWCNQSYNSKHAYSVLKRPISNLGKINCTSSKPIFKLDKNTGCILEEFLSVADAARKIGGKPTTITASINRNHNSYGFKWKHKC